jgi:hypothetical protein
MRVRFYETLTPSELKAELTALCDDLEGLGIERIARGNLYFLPMVGSQYVDIVSESGTILAYLLIGPR